MNTLTVNALSLSEQEATDLYAALASEENTSDALAHDYHRDGNLDASRLLRHRAHRIRQLRLRVGSLISEAVEAQTSGEPLDEQRRRLVG